MGTNASIEDGLAASNVAFQTGWDGAFTKQTLPGVFSLYAEVMTGVTSEVTQFEQISNHAVGREWVGARREKFFREYNFSTKLKTWEATHRVPRKTLAYRDKLGVISKGIQDWISNQKTIFDMTAFQAYLSAAGAGPTCYDGAALFSASHPHSGAGGNQSNIGAAANLSASTLDAAMTAMGSLTLENGEPAGYMPTHLVVGPALARRAKSLIGYDSRVVVVSAAGLQDVVASGVAAATVPNVFNGELTLVVDNRRIGSVAGTNVSYFWDVLDLSRPGIRPMMKLVGLPPTPDELTKPTDPNVFFQDDFLYGWHGDWVDDAYAWHCAYRGTGTA